MTTLSHLISTMPACWRDDYKRAVARSVLSTNRAAYDGATGLPNGNGNMLQGYETRPNGRGDRRPRGQGRDQFSSGTNPSFDQIDSGTLLDFVNMAYHRLPPDEQDQLCQGLSDLIASHQNPMNGDEQENMEPRGSGPNGGSLLEELGGNTATFSPLESMSGTRTPGAPGGQDKNLRRFTTLDKKRRPAQDQVLASSRRQRREAGFLTRFPDASKINVGGHY